MSTHTERKHIVGDIFFDNTVSQVLLKEIMESMLRYDTDIYWHDLYVCPSSFTIYQKMGLHFSCPIADTETYKRYSRGIISILYEALGIDLLSNKSDPLPRGVVQINIEGATIWTHTRHPCE